MKDTFLNKSYENFVIHESIHIFEVFYFVGGSNELKQFNLALCRTKFHSQKMVSDQEVLKRSNKIQLG